MLIVYVGPEKSVLVGDGIEFVKGEPVEVTSELGKSLLQQPTFSTVKKEP